MRGFEERVVRLVFRIEGCVDAPLALADRKRDAVSASAIDEAVRDPCSGDEVDDVSCAERDLAWLLIGFDEPHVTLAFKHPDKLLFVGVCMREARTLAGWQAVKTDADVHGAERPANVAKKSEAFLVEGRRVVPFLLGDVGREDNERIGWHGRAT